MVLQSGQPIQIELYATEPTLSNPDGFCPFSVWFSNLDKPNKLLVNKRLLKIQQGLLGNNRWLEKGVLEIKFTKPAFRLYCGDDGDQLIILLMAGDKSSQQTDIQRAYVYWEDYLKSKEDDDNDQPQKKK